MFSSLEETNSCGRPRPGDRQLGVPTDGVATSDSGLSAQLSPCASTSIGNSLDHALSDAKKIMEIYVVAQCPWDEINLSPTFRSCFGCFRR